MRVNCKVCSAESLPLAKAQVLAKHEVAYFRCAACGFVQIEVPYWLKESYADAIASTDIGLIHRSLELARMLNVMLPLVADPAGRFIDYGGGNGMLVRMLRDECFDFHWYDAYSDNQFAEGFEAEPGARYELLTAFEVLEHLEEPRARLTEMLDLSDRVLISTYLLPEPCPLPADWWYYGLDHGQHIALYSRTALTKLAVDAGEQLFSNGDNLNLISRRPVSAGLFRLASRKWAQALLTPFFRRRSLLQDDFSRGLPMFDWSDQVGQTSLPAPI